MRRLLPFLAVAMIGIGAALTRTLEPGIVVEAVAVPVSSGPALAALRFRPEPSRERVGRPTAVLAHGITASKETLFVLGEAFAAAGFDALAIDLPGHGGSPGPFGRSADLVGSLVAGARLLEGAAAVGSGASVDVLAGHSLGAGVATSAVASGRVGCRLVVAIGTRALVPPGGPPELLLLGAHDELLERGDLEAVARGRARLVVSPASDHVLEPWDPALVSAAVKASCEAVGLPAPRERSRWRARLTGTILAGLGALLLLGTAPPRGPLGRTRGALVGAAAAGVAIGTLALAGACWVGATFVLARAPQQVAFGLAALGASLAVAAVASRVERLRGARATWGQLAITATLAVGAAACALGGDSFPALVLGLGTGVLGIAAGTGWLVTWRTLEPASAHAAFAGILGYALGQWMPLVI